MEWGKGWWSSPLLDQAVPWITHLGSLYALLVFLAVSCLIIRRREVILVLLVLYGVLVGSVYGLKFLIGRPRPFQVLAMAQALSRTRIEVIDPGFPSAHSAYAFAMAALLGHWFPKYRILFYILAGIVAWTRIYLFLHFSTDVIAGGILGYGLTRTVLHLLSRDSRSRKDLKIMH